MLTFLRTYAKDIFASQNGEEGILLECVKRIGIEHGHAVEIGGNNGLWCSNTALLIRDYGWSGLFLESDFNLWRQCLDNWAGNPNVRSQCSEVDKYNVNAFVKEDCSLVSLDTDGGDYQIFKGIRSKPAIVIVEIDSSHRPEEYKFNPDGGAGYRPMLELGIEKGYFLLCHTGNLILIANEFREKFPECTGDALVNSSEYFNTSWLAT